MGRKIENISVIGIGRLGLAWALVLDVQDLILSDVIFWKIM